MRWLITGAGGQLGIDLARWCEHNGDEVIAVGHGELDITDRSAVLSAITAASPDLIVNCAAWTAVDACESDPDRALAVNGLAVRWLAEATARVGGHLVQISTDYVFDGDMDRPYHEWDETEPTSVYGASKLVGEQEARALGAAATVIRTSWVCGVNGSNMVKTILRLAAERDQLTFVADQTGCPTFTHDLAAAVRRLAVDRCSGVVHVTNQGAVSWFEFAQQVVLATGRDPGMVLPITTDQLDPPRPAPRPINSVLDNAVLRMAGYGTLRHFSAPLQEVVAALTE
jgi:dTDP-4-dehydrorhamnose reductase